MSRRAAGPCALTLLAPAAACLFSQLASAADDIRDLRGPKTALSGWPLSAVAAVAVALAVAGYFAWRRLRRTPPPVALTAAQAALAGLEAARALIAPARSREFCDAVSDVVRHYIEVQFSLSAQRRTTEEFLQQLSAMPASPVAAHQSLLAEFLQHCDFVRFSGTSADAASLEALFQAARTFVINTASVAHDPLSAT